MTHAETAAAVVAEGLAIATIAAASLYARNLTLLALTLPVLALAVLFDYGGQNAVITSALGMTVGALGVHINQTVNRLRADKAVKMQKAQASGRMTA